MSHAFTAQSLGKTFGSLEVLKGASLWGVAGSVTALLGRNGSGKTTLIECAFGLTRADYGVVKVGKHVFERPSPHRLARLGVFYLPERDLLSPAHTVERHLKAAVRLPRPTSTRQGTDSPGDYLAVAERLGIAEIVHRRCFQISGGERRRAELAIAFLRQPLCLLADEPFAGITPVDRVAVAVALRELAGQGCAVIVTGHDVADVLDLADTVT
jgi:ABC-type multidrug transport system ATPase subunit